MKRFDESPRADLGLAIAAGLLGAAGVVLASVAAHVVPDASLATAANFLVMHAAAVLGVSAWAGRSPSAPGWWRVAARLLLLGVALFAGEIALRGLAGQTLFPMAAPTGGIAMILGWTCVAVAAAIDWARVGSNT